MKYTTMARRKKSVTDIANQRDRLKELIMSKGYQGEYGSPEFWASYYKIRDAQDKVERIADTYIRNIHRTPSYSKGMSEINRATRDLSPTRSMLGMATGIAKLNDRKYSQATYMGLASSNG